MPRPEELPLRITLVDPPTGIRFHLQKGRDGQEPPSRATDGEISFDFAVRLGEQPDGRPNFLGPYAQGRPADRFVYVGSPGRRAKVPLYEIGWERIETVRSQEGTLLAARIEGTAKDGGAACASVPLLGDGWTAEPG